MSDLAGSVRGARDDLADLDARISDLWRHLYASDGPIPEQARKEKRKRTHSPELWAGPGQVQAAYIDVVVELARAHWELGRHTDVPVHWTRRPDASEQAPTVPHSEALAWTRVLDGMLAWLTGEQLDTEAQQAVTTACAHIAAARGRVEDLWPSKHIPLPDPAPVCLHCTDREAEKQRKWCSKCRRAHQADRGRCDVCGLEVAS